jgi:peroxiredoxin Q/BCP
MLERRRSIRGIGIVWRLNFWGVAVVLTLRALLSFVSMIKVGQEFPKFALPNQDNQTMKLSDFGGKWVVVFVYPKDDTPGCTLEGRGFSAAKAEFDSANAVVLGLSEDDVESHKNFCNKFSFTIPLLADPQASLLNALGITQSEWKGTKYWDRTTFLVDPKGVVRKVYANVKPEGHEREVLRDVQSMQGI